VIPDYVRPNIVALVMRIIDFILKFVNADYCIPILDFVGKLNETTANERAESV